MVKTPQFFLASNVGPKGLEMLTDLIAVWNVLDQIYGCSKPQHQYNRDMDILERVQGRAMEMMKGLEHLYGTS